MHKADPQFKHPRPWQCRFFFFFFFLEVQQHQQHMADHSNAVTVRSHFGQSQETQAFPCPSIITRVLNGWLMILLPCGYIHVSFQENNNLHISILALGRESMRIKCSVFCPLDRNAALEDIHVESGISCPFLNDAHVLVNMVS